METFQPAHTHEFESLLSDRITDLQKKLQTWLAETHTGAARDHEVTDFKEAAEEETLESVEAAQVDQAAHDLEQALVALRRLHEKKYGSCQMCGQPIDLRRLRALPTATLCAFCQARQETRATARSRPR